MPITSGMEQPFKIIDREHLRYSPKYFTAVTNGSKPNWREFTPDAVLTRCPAPDWAKESQEDLSARYRSWTPLPGDAELNRGLYKHLNLLNPESTARLILRFLKEDAPQRIPYFVDRQSYRNFAPSRLGRLFDDYPFEDLDKVVFSKQFNEDNSRVILQEDKTGLQIQLMHFGNIWRASHVSFNAPPIAPTPPSFFSSIQSNTGNPNDRAGIWATDCESHNSNAPMFLLAPLFHDHLYISAMCFRHGCRNLPQFAKAMHIDKDSVFEPVDEEHLRLHLDRLPPDPLNRNAPKALDDKPLPAPTLIRCHHLKELEELQKGLETQFVAWQETTAQAQQHRSMVLNMDYYDPIALSRVFLQAVRDQNQSLVPYFVSSRHYLRYAPDALKKRFQDTPWEQLDSADFSIAYSQGNWGLRATVTSSKLHVRLIFVNDDGYWRLGTER